jgi:hypothetical protein
MGSSLGEILINTFLGSPRVTAGVSTGVNRVAGESFKTAGYASIPYPRPPQVLDTVPTKGLLPGYSTHEKVWVA